MFLDVKSEPLTSFIALVKLEGEADLAASQHLKDEAKSVMKRGISHLIVDLDGLQFIDSSGLRALVEARKEARENGGDLTLVCTKAHTRKILEITGLGSLFGVHYNEMQALCSVAGRIADLAALPETSAEAGETVPITPNPFAYQSA